MPRRDTDAPASRPAVARLAALLHDGDVDAAIEAGLMEDWPLDALDALDDDSRALLLDTRLRLRVAWEARARHLRRAARLARTAAERAAARAPSAPGGPITAGSDARPRPALPASAAAILARARARAGKAPG